MRRRFLLTLLLVLALAPAAETSRLRTRGSATAGGGGGGGGEPTATVFVRSTSSSDANPCTAASPCLTLAHGLSILTSGQTLEIMDSAVYNESILDGAVPNGGGTWETATEVRSAAGQTATLRPTAGNFADGRVMTLSTAQSWIRFRRIFFDAVNTNAISQDAVKVTGGSHHIEVKDSRIENSDQGMGLLVSGEIATWVRMIGGRSCNHGLGYISGDALHGIYLSGTQDNHIEGVEVCNNKHWGIHAFQGAGPGTARTVIIGNYVHGNDGGIDSHGDDAIIILNRIGPNTSGGIRNLGNRSRIHHNTLHGHEFGIVVDGLAGGGHGADHSVKNNTISGNSTASELGHAIVNVGQFATNAVVRGNVGNATILDSGTNSTITANVESSSTVNLVDPLNGNFHLNAGSSALGAGVSDSDVTDLVTVDADGGAWNSPRDAGAFEDQ